MRPIGILPASLVIDMGPISTKPPRQVVSLVNVSGIAAEVVALYETATASTDIDADYVRAELDRLRAAPRPRGRIGKDIALVLGEPGNSNPGAITNAIARLRNDALRWNSTAADRTGRRTPRRRRQVEQDPLPGILGETKVTL